MKSKTQRKSTPVVLYAADVSKLTGSSIRSARHKLRRVRSALGKPPNGFVTVKEFADFFSIDETQVNKFLDN